MCALSTRITFSDEQSMLLDTAVAFCRDKSPVSAVRAQLGTEHGFDRAVWGAIVELGWTGIAVPERFGGSGLSLAEVATIAEPMGRHLLATPFTSTQLLVQALVASGHEALQQSVLPRLCAGDIGTVALTEADGDWDLLQPASSATRDGKQLRLAGHKTLVTDAAVAQHLLVSVRLDGAPALVLLDAAALPAGCLSREGVIDETRRAFRLNLQGVSAPDAALIAGPGAVAALNAVRDAGMLIAAAEATGGIAGALDVIVEYLNLRTTFGRKIGSYQALKHTAAEILIALERSRSHLYHAATLLRDGAGTEIALRMAKTEACDGIAFAGDRAVQFHGGFGFTYECDAQLFLRRALWLQYTFGDSAHHRRRLADLLLAA